MINDAHTKLRYEDHGRALGPLHETEDSLIYSHTNMKYAF